MVLRLPDVATGSLFQGDVGPQGPRGMMGPRGSNGRPGVDGKEGPIGQQGPPGRDGDRGEQGPMGLAGNPGPQGRLGAQGAPVRERFTRATRAFAMTSCVVAFTLNDHCLDHSTWLCMLPGFEWRGRRPRTTGSTRTPG